MKILHLSTTDVSGGAARAAYRLHMGLLNSGIYSHMIVQYKDDGDQTIHGPRTNFSKALSLLRPMIDHAPKIFSPFYKNSFFHLQWLPNRLKPIINKIKPDIIHLHWICRGFINIESLRRFGIPIVWTLHDMWPFTGGCHYTNGCKRFAHSCGRCPILKSNNEFDLSRWVWKRKFKEWKDINIKLIAPSQWIKSQALESSLFKNVVCKKIPYGIDTDKYKPINQKTARQLLNLPHDKTLIMFSAMNATNDTRKGFQYLLPALRILSANNIDQKLDLVVLGSNHQLKDTRWGINTHYIGTLHDELSIALVYSACDVFVAPSTEDNLPNTVIEALCCGIPSVAFDIGGMPDLIDHQNSGYLAKPYSIDDLANGIKWVISDQNRKTVLSSNARSLSVSKYEIKRIVERHLEIYNLQRNDTV